MNFGSELQALDCIGLPRFTLQQCKAIVDRVKKTGALVCDPPPCEGQGIVIAGGGRYLDWSLVLVRHLRKIGCNLPIQVWHLGPKEMPEAAKKWFAKSDAETVDTFQVMKQFPVREMGGWHLKTYAIRHCPWKRVMLIDADCVPQVVPEEIFNDVDVRRVGNLFFHDVGSHNNPWFYVDFSLTVPEREWETGNMVWDKVSGWLALRWALWCAEHASVFWHQERGHGEKSTVEASFRVSGCPYMIGGPSVWAGYGIEHSFKDRIAFKHIMGTKRGEWPMEDWMKAAFEEVKSLRL